jgi:hypothetical protein
MRRQRDLGPTVGPRDAEPRSDPLLLTKALYTRNTDQKPETNNLDRSFASANLPRMHRLASSGEFANVESSTERGNTVPERAFQDCTHREA